MFISSLIKMFTGNWGIFGISSTGGRAPEYRLPPDCFQTVKRRLAPDWAQKMLCIMVPNRRTASLEFFSRVRTRLLLCLKRYPGALPPVLGNFDTPFLPARLTVPGSPRMHWDLLYVNWNREEKLVRHVSMIAKFLDDKKTKKVNSHSFKLHRSYSVSINLANVGEIFSRWIRKDRV